MSGVENSESKAARFESEIRIFRNFNDDDRRKADTHIVDSDLTLEDIEQWPYSSDSNLDLHGTNMKPWAFKRDPLMKRDSADSGFASPGREDLTNCFEQFQISNEFVTSRDIHVGSGGSNSPVSEDEFLEQETIIENSLSKTLKTDVYYQDHNTFPASKGKVKQQLRPLPLGYKLTMKARKMLYGETSQGSPPLPVSKTDSRLGYHGSHRRASYPNIVQRQDEETDYVKNTAENLKHNISEMHDRTKNEIEMSVTHNNSYINVMSTKTSFDANREKLSKFTRRGSLPPLKIRPSLPPITIA